MSPKRDAEEARHDLADDAHREGDAGPVDHPGQHVPSLGVGPEPVGQAGAEEVGVFGIALVRARGGHERGEERGPHHERHEHQAQLEEAVPAESGGQGGGHGRIILEDRD